MSKTYEYVVKPTIIDADNNENALDNITITGTFTNNVVQEIELASGDEYISLPIIKDHKLVNLVSNYPIKFEILNQETGAVITDFVDVKNIIIEFSGTYTYKLKNNSENTATIVFRLFA